jgi:hypothetical protein
MISELPPKNMGMNAGDTNLLLNNSKREKVADMIMNIPYTTKKTMDIFSYEWKWIFFINLLTRTVAKIVMRLRAVRKAIVKLFSGNGSQSQST